MISDDNHTSGDEWVMNDGDDNGVNDVDDIGRQDDHSNDDKNETLPYDSSLLKDSSVLPDMRPWLVALWFGW